MKKLLVLAFCVLSFALFASNSHVVGGSMLYAGDGLIPEADWYWMAWTLDEPADVVDSNSSSSVYYGASVGPGGYTMNCQDFLDWQVGDILHIEYYMCPGSGNTAPVGQYVELDYVTTGAGFDPIPPYPDPQYFDQPCAVTLTAFQAALQEEFVAISWTTASEAELNCFNIYRDDVLVHTEAATNTSADVDYQFIDSEDIVNNEIYVYDLEVVNLDGSTQDLGSITFTVEIEEDDIVNATAFHNVYPNPISNGDTQKIKLSVKTGETATLTVYNAKGQVVDTFEYEGGNHEDTFTPNYASGIYFYKLEGNNYSAVKKMLILK